MHSVECLGKIQYFDVVVVAYQLDGLRVDAQPFIGFCLPVVLGMVGRLKLVGKPEIE